MKKRSMWKRIMAAALVLLLAAVAVCGLYINDYYHADAAAMAVLEQQDGVTVTEESGRMVFAPEKPTAGLLFYPGGKVEYTAYAPLMDALARQGILCVLFRMPANLAVLDGDAADGVPEEYPEVERWYIGGHSLGGVMAANYAADEGEQLEGLVLLASYSTADLSDSGLLVLSIYGSEDGVLSMDKYRKAWENLPADAVEVVIEGGSHALFGSYGPQEGDGQPTITSEQQIEQTVEAIVTLTEEDAA